MTKHQKLVKAIAEGDLFDFISSNGHEFSKDDLVTLTKELSYAACDVFRRRKMVTEYSDFRETVIENLPDYWSDGEVDN